MELAIAIIGAVATVAAAGAAVGSWLAARRSNETAASLAAIERDRRHSELTPRFRILWEPANPGVDALTLRLVLTGSSGLDRVDRLTVRIRDDHFRRDDWPLTAGGPTREQVQAQIWGPFRFRPHTGPDDARADETGRVTEYDHVVPVGEQLQFLLEPTWPPPWSQQPMEAWRAQCGNVVRLALVAEHQGYGSWTLPAEIDVGEKGMAGSRYVP